MLTPPFESLRRRLIDDGFAPRYARRLSGELADHFESLRAELACDGLDPDAAEACARQRIGTDEAILDRARAMSRHRSLVRRRPVWCFIIAPFVVMAIAALIIVIAVVIVAEFIPLGPDSRAPVLSYLATRLALPIIATLLASGWIAHAHRRSCPWRWPLVACGLLAAMCATVGIHVMSPTSTSPGTIAIGVGPPPQNWMMVLPLAVFVAYWILLRLRSQRTTSGGDAEAVSY